MSYCYFNLTTLASLHGLQRLPGRAEHMGLTAQLNSEHGFNGFSLGNNIFVLLDYYELEHYCWTNGTCYEVRHNFTLGRGWLSSGSQSTSDAKVTLLHGGQHVWSSPLCCPPCKKLFFNIDDIWLLLCPCFLSNVARLWNALCAQSWCNWNVCNVM